jgi:hypothetical protein
VTGECSEGIIENDFLKSKKKTDRADKEQSGDLSVFFRSEIAWPVYVHC